MRWFEDVDRKEPEIISSRIRLVRNLSDYEFSSKLSKEKAQDMVHRLEFGLKDLGDLDGRSYGYISIDQLSDLHRMLWKERRVLNTAAVESKKPAGMMITDEEDVSMIFNGDDHIRIQLMSAGFCLEELWQEADGIDDYINERFSYAYDDKYGYLTSFPTNVGTGLRASVVMHLPMMSMGKKFGTLAGELARFGVSIKGIYGEGKENYGALFEISNQKTLGQSEKEILEVVGKAARQLVNQEKQLRSLSMVKNRLEREDEAYKSYGVLKYARRLLTKDALTFLSQLMAGTSDHLISLKNPGSIYKMMIGIQDANLQSLSDKPLSKEELNIARADYIRRELPQIE